MNERIRAKEVRLIDQNGENLGVVETVKALKMAYDADLDLVLISPNQVPPVAKILNYGKYCSSIIYFFDSKSNFANSAIFRAVMSGCGLELKAVSRVVSPDRTRTPSAPAL